MLSVLLYSYSFPDCNFAIVRKKIKEIIPTLKRLDPMLFIPLQYILLQVEIMMPQTEYTRRFSQRTEGPENRQMRHDNIKGRKPCLKHQAASIYYMDMYAD